MFGLIKKIFKKNSLQEGVMAPTSAPAYSRTATPGQSRHPNPFSNNPPKSSHAAPPSPPTTSASAPAAKPKSTIPQSPSGGSEILLPLKELVDSLPDDVRKLFSATIPDNAQLKLDQNVILPQLAGGRVKVHLGTVRNQISNGIYLGSPEQDNVEANIPLPMIIPRINPAKLPRRGQRLAMDVPEDVTGLFGTIGEPLPTSTRLPKNPAPAAPAPKAAPGNTPLPPNKTAPASPAPASPARGPSTKDHRQAAEAFSNSNRPSTQPKRQSVSEDLLEDIPSPFAFGQAPAPASAKPPAPQAVPKPPAAPPRSTSEPTESIKFDSEKFFKKETSRHPFAPREEKPTASPQMHSDAIPIPGAPRTQDSVPKPPSAVSAPAPAQQKPAPKPAEAPQPAPSQSSPRIQGVLDENYINVTVAEASEGWPEPVLNEIQQYNLTTAQIALPFGEVDMTMRKGRVEFTWKQLRDWIAGGGTPASTENDDVSLLIPLKVVAPKFLTQRQPRNKQQQVKVEESIPDVFSGAPEPEPEPAVSAKAAPTQDTEPAAPVPSEVESAEEASPSTAKATAKPAPKQVKAPKISAGNPKDLVEKTSTLPGVDGALLAMHDGLVVASQLKKPLVSETVAAFLPQIFARLTQFATEIKLGELSSVMMVAGNCPWIIFRTNKVYFAVVGKPGEALPLAQLTAIVADINKQNL